MGKARREIEEQSKGQLTRGINVFKDIADWCADLVAAGEAESVAQLVDPYLRGPLETLHKSKGKKAEMIRKLKDELRSSKASKRDASRQG
jgi:hypothetical protein